MAWASEDAVVDGRPRGAVAATREGACQQRCHARGTAEGAPRSRGWECSPTHGIRSRAGMTQTATTRRIDSRNLLRQASARLVFLRRRFGCGIARALPSRVLLSRGQLSRTAHTHARLSRQHAHARAHAHALAPHAPAPLPRRLRAAAAAARATAPALALPKPSGSHSQTTSRKPAPSPPPQPLLHSTHVHALLRPFPAPTRPRAPHLWEADRARRARAVCRASSHVHGNAQPPHTRRKRTQNSHHGQPFTLMAPKQSDPESETRHAGGGRRSAWAGGSECWLTTYYRKPRRAMRVTGSLRRRPRR